MILLVWQVTALRSIPGVSSNYFAQWEFVNNIPHPEPKYSDIPISVIYYGPRHLEQGIDDITVSDMWQLCFMINRVHSFHMLYDYMRLCAC